MLAWIAAELHQDFVRVRTKSAFTPEDVAIFMIAMFGQPAVVRSYFALNEATCVRGCASAHVITSCECV